MTLLRSHWFWLFAILTVVSGLDYWNHIARPGSPFAEAPGAWFGFTSFSLASVILISVVGSQALGRLEIPRIIADTLAVMAAIAAHLTFTGPLWDRIFWTGNLKFDAILWPTGIAAIVYLLYRAQFSIVAHMLRKFRPALS